MSRVLPEVTRDEIRKLIRRGVSLRAIERLTGVHRDTVMRIRDERTFSDQRSDGVCRYMNQRKRIELWGKQVPEGKRLGWTCKVAYCGNPQHFALAEHRSASWRNYKEIRVRLWALKEGESFDLLDEPNDEKSRTKFRCALGTNSPHFLLRSLPRATGIRIIRAADWYDDIRENVRAYPILTKLRKPTNTGQLPGAFYLGFLGGCWTDTGPCKSRCSIKGCPFPSTAAALVCRRHSLAEWELQYASDLDKRDMIAPKEYPNLPLALYVDFLSRDRYGFLWSQTYKGNSTYVGKSREEKMNDQWWQENVIEKGLITDADGVLHQMQSERELKAVMGERESRDNISRFFGAQVSGSGKMRLGGGRGKIRKKQRRRPAGWHGSRDDTKSNRPDRETIEVIDDWEIDEDADDLTGDYGEESAP